MPFATNNDVETRVRAWLPHANKAVVGTDPHVQHLYCEDVRTHPIFYFGGIATASYVTIGANPSADDFRKGRWTSGDLADNSFSYFNRVEPHSYFGKWEAALAPLALGASYSNGGLAHIDVSPRPTRSLGAISKLGDSAIDEFLAMAHSDSEYMFDLLSLVWSQVRGVFAAGTLTKRYYLGEFLCRVGPERGFQFQRQQMFPGRASGTRARTALFDVVFGNKKVPLLSCPVGPSSRGAADQEYFQSQISENAASLRPIFL